MSIIGIITYLTIGVIIYSLAVIWTQLIIHDVLPSNRATSLIKKWFQSDNESSYIVLFSVSMIWPITFSVFFIWFLTALIIKYTTRIIKSIKENEENF